MLEHVWKMSSESYQPRHGKIFTELVCTCGDKRFIVTEVPACMNGFKLSTKEKVIIKIESHMNEVLASYSDVHEGQSRAALLKELLLWVNENC